MFEDSIFESTGRIHTRTRDWMLAAFLLNSSIVIGLVLIPLFHPEALPQQLIPFFMQTPRTPAQRTPPLQAAHAAPGAVTVAQSPFQAPRIIPQIFTIPDRPETLAPVALPGQELDNGVPGGVGLAVPGPAVRPIVRPAPIALMRVSSSVVAGLLVHQTIPAYPPIALASRTEGTVELAAIISKAGTIENLRVVSGPLMLRQAAMDAVRTWRYKPYLLDGEPVEVETTVLVNFRLQ